MKTFRFQQLSHAAMIAVLASLLLTPAYAARVIRAQTASPTTPPAPTVSATQAATALSTTQAPAPATSAPALLMTVPATAPAAPAFTIDGSKIVSPILTQATAAYSQQHPNVTASIAVSGTSAGFDKLCSGTVDMAMANAGITDQQAAACDSQKVQYVELLLGFDAAVLVVNSASQINCLATSDVITLLSPSAVGKFQNWNQLAQATTTPLPSQPLSAIYSTQDTRARDLISTLIPGGTLRSDISVQPDEATAITKLIADANGVALLTLADYQKSQADGKAVRALDLQNGTVCTTANALNLGNNRYPAGESLYLYVNAASLSRAPVADFLNYLVSADGQKAVTGANFTPADPTVYTRDQTYLTAKQTGRTFSRIQSVNIAADTAGTIKVNGSPAAFDAIKAVSDAFQPLYTKITLTQTPFGNDSGCRNVCAGGVDLIGATRLPTDAETSQCKANSINPIQLTLGAQGVVLLINAGNTFATCLTTDQLGKLFGIASDSKVKKWSDVDSKFPATDLLLLSPNDGDLMTDLLITKTVKGVAPLARTDMTQNSDPLYRASGTANVAGAITYMSYTDYKTVTSKLTLVQVDSGKGCVAPSDKTLADGTYPLSQQIYLFLNPAAFARPEVKAFVWYLLSDDALAVLSSKSNLVGLDRAGFISARDTALTLFAQTPAGTPGPGTPTAPPAVATTSATAGATGAPTTAPTAVPTIAATAAPTKAATAAG